MNNESMQRIEFMFTENISTLERIENKLEEHDAIFNAMHGILKDILANLTEETGADLAMALRKLTEAVNALGTTVAANPGVIVSKLRKEMKPDGSVN